jgi:hypothetical protein
VPRTRRRNSSREPFGRDAIRAWMASGQPVRAVRADRGLNEATCYARRGGTRLPGANRYV